MSSPYPSLQTRELPTPEIWDIPPPAELQAAMETRFKPFQTTYPGMLRFGKTKKQTSFLRFDHKWHATKHLDKKKAKKKANKKQENRNKIGND